MLRAAALPALALVFAGTACLRQLPSFARAHEALTVYYSNAEQRRARARLQALLVVLCVLTCLRRTPPAARAIAALAPLGPAFVAGFERRLREPWELWP